MSLNQRTETVIDQEIILLIRQRDAATLAAIYKEVYPMVLKHITTNKGSREDAQDIFQDAFYILIKKTESSDFVLTSQVSTFLVGISKNLWLKKLTRVTLNTQLYIAENESEEVQLEADDEKKLAEVRHMNFALNNLGEPCRTILVQFYHFNKTMQEIAALFHYTNADNAKNQKYKCLQRLKKLITGSHE